MPRRDRKGPLGQGMLSGRGLGGCTNGNANPRSGSRLGQGRGLNFRAGLGNWCRRGCGININSKSDEEILEEEKAYLKSRLDQIEQQLQNNKA